MRTGCPFAPLASEINLGDYLRACGQLASAPSACLEIARLLRFVAAPAAARGPRQPRLSLRIRRRPQVRSRRDDAALPGIPSADAATTPDAEEVHPLPSTAPPFRRTSGPSPGVRMDALDQGHD